MARWPFFNRQFVPQAVQIESQVRNRIRAERGMEVKMDIKAQISKVVEEISKNPNIKEQFDKEPVKVIEKVVGIDLPDDIIMKVVDGVKAKLTIDGVSKAADTLKGIFK